MLLEEVEIAYRVINRVQQELLNEIQDITNTEDYRKDCADKILLLTSAKDILVDYESTITD